MLPSTEKQGDQDFPNGKRLPFDRASTVLVFPALSSPSVARVISLQHRDLLFITVVFCRPILNYFDALSNRLYTKVGARIHQHISLPFLLLAQC